MVMCRGSNFRLFCVLLLVALNTILGSCSKAFNFNAARTLVNRMKEGEFSVPRTTQTIYPDEISYSLLLSSCRDPSAAKEILKEVKCIQWPLLDVSCHSVVYQNLTPSLGPVPTVN